MPTEQYYTKKEILLNMAQQRLIYKGLQKDFDKWFNNAIELLYTFVDVDKYIKIEYQL